ncbi:hypothetical protein D5278_12825 [bacterium 1XD21-13]|nr:hypothetical protein [bacterium 1XD21-13]
MQKVSRAYKESMKRPLRNRAYIHISIGVINQDAQKTACADVPENAFTSYSSLSKPFNIYEIDSIYATAEQDFARTDGSMVFLPRNSGDAVMNNGIVTERLLGSIEIRFGMADLNIRGLTIDFGEAYPTAFTIESDSGIREYTGNTLSLWSTEDVFTGVSFFRITPLSMVNGQGRLRIYKFLCGVGNVFTNKDVKSYSFKDYVSPISDRIPSQDMSLTVYNYSLRYNIDNPKSAIHFMELGQEIRVSFGYDVTGNGDIEWLESNEVYLKTWDADDKQAKFMATDTFDNRKGTYYKGRYRKEGITAYDLALDILEDMGLEENEYAVDPYLKGVLLYNPVPVVSHVEALQMLANACRCVLFQNRSRKIQIKSSFTPDMTASTNQQAIHSHVENVLGNGVRTSYAAAFRDFAKTDGSMIFLPRNREDFFDDTGYVSAAVCDENGEFEENPIVEIILESAYNSYGMGLSFRSVPPEEFIIRTYNDERLLNVLEVTGNEETECILNQSFEDFDRMEIEFTKGYPNSRIALDRIGFGDVTDYILEYDMDLTATPKGRKQEQLKSLSVIRTIYSESTKEAGQIYSEEMRISPEKYERVVYFNKASYEISAAFVMEREGGETVYGDTLPNGTRVRITESSDFYAKLCFDYVTAEQTIQVVINGKEYQTNESRYAVQHNTIGEEKVWKNELIGTVRQAEELEQWLAEYYQAPIEYEVSYRGDPRVDANDLFFLELRNREQAMIRCYQNELKYNGAWSGKMKVRKVMET